MKRVYLFESDQSYMYGPLVYEFHISRNERTRGWTLGIREPCSDFFKGLEYHKFETAEQLSSMASELNFEAGEMIEALTKTGIPALVQLGKELEAFEYGEEVEEVEGAQKVDAQP